MADIFNIFDADNFTREFIKKQVIETNSEVDVSENSAFDDVFIKPIIPIIRKLIESLSNIDYKSNLNQSTTGNITGMYDVHGGAWEVTMSFYQAIPVNSAIPSNIEPKDYEIFTSTDVNTACNGNICYGYALSETLNWFQSSNAMINASYPTLTFGGSHYQDGGSGFRFFQSKLQMPNNSSRILIQTK